MLLSSFFITSFMSVKYKLVVTRCTYFSNKARATAWSLWDAREENERSVCTGYRREELMMSNKERSLRRGQNVPSTTHHASSFTSQPTAQASMYSFVHPPTCRSIHLPKCIHIYPSTQVCIYPSTCAYPSILKVPVSSSTHAFIYSSIQVYIYSSIYSLSAHLSI